METPRRIALDTDVLIEHLRDKGGGLVGALEERAELATTVVNAFELYHGAYRSKQTAKNLSAVKNLLSALTLLGMDDVSAERSGEALANLEREGKPIDPRDLFVGCAAVRNGYALMTNNRKHFERVPGLRVLSPSDVPRPPR
ncbi:MAG: type II toxin-antitoxin system VapC family toxin [Nitrososphaerota archaeon]|nr:type II toxin-antitoxin system VapC family toxin [Nitrososphaerota archaeon]